MRGFSYRSEDHDPSSENLPAWESLVVDAVGDVIEFWGFKRNHGRLWGLLYLRQSPMASSELQEALGLSKGSVSMITRDLEQWVVIERVRLPGSSAWHFVAEVDFMQMIGRVLREREGQMVSRVKADLAEAERLAGAANVPAAIRDRIARMRMLAGMMEHAIELFLKTARLDVTRARDIL